MKDHIKDNIMNFFIIVTLVNLVMFISGSILAPEMRFGYEAFIVPIIDGLLGIIPGIIMYSKRELTVRQMLIREVIQLLAKGDDIAAELVCHGVDLSTSQT